MADQKTTDQRLEAHAAAIRDLRKRVAALETAVERLTGPGATPVAPASGVFVPRAHCAMCGELKEAGRIELTCKACGSLRYAIITGKSDESRDRITHVVCANCERPKPGSTKMLCTPCGDAFKRFKAGQ